MKFCDELDSKTYRQYLTNCLAISSSILIIGNSLLLNNIKFTILVILLNVLSIYLNFQVISCLQLLTLKNKIIKFIYRHPSNYKQESPCAAEGKVINVLDYGKQLNAEIISVENKTLSWMEGYNTLISVKDLIYE